jgi:hypothetical protein
MFSARQPGRRGLSVESVLSSKNEALVRDISKRLEVYREYGSIPG